MNGKIRKEGDMSIDADERLSKQLEKMIAERDEAVVRAERSEKDVERWKSIVCDLFARWKQLGYPSVVYHVERGLKGDDLDALEKAFGIKETKGMI